MTTTASRRVDINVRANTAEAQRNLRKVDTGLGQIGKAARGMALGVLGGFLSFQALTSGIIRNTIELHAGREEFWRLNDAAQRFANTLAGPVFDKLAEIVGPISDLVNELDTLFGLLSKDGEGETNFIKTFLDNLPGLKEAGLGIKLLTTGVKALNDLLGAGQQGGSVLISTEEARKNLDELNSYELDLATKINLQLEIIKSYFRLFKADVKQIFDDVINFLKADDAWKKVTDKVKTWKDGIVTIFTEFKDKVLLLMETVINGAIEGINSMIRDYNKAAKWVPGLPQVGLLNKVNLTGRDENKGRNLKQGPSIGYPGGFEITEDMPYQRGQRTGMIEVPRSGGYPTTMPDETKPATTINVYGDIQDESKFSDRVINVLRDSYLGGGFPSVTGRGFGEYAQEFYGQ